jgi:hypothetical protein
MDGAQDAKMLLGLQLTLGHFPIGIERGGPGIIAIHLIMICEILRPEGLVCRVTERIPVFNWRPSASHLITREC